jgi:DNA-binding PadR family transcriptional regulator
VVQIDKDLVAASSTPLVLAILSEGESYGYAILKRVREASDGELEWTDGMLYPLLHRLHRLGYVTQEWRAAPEGRRRRYYAITEEGHRALEEHKRQWTAVTRVLGDVFGRDLLPFTERAVPTRSPRPRAARRWRVEPFPVAYAWA